MSEISPGLPEGHDDVEFMMDDFQLSLGQSKPVREVQFLGESPALLNKSN